jgi:sortase (surface protein transpeptidase)
VPGVAPPHERQRRCIAAALTLVGATIGVVATAGSLATATADGAMTPRPREMPIPVRVVIPAIRVSAPIIPLGLNKDRTLEVPRIFSQAGWFRGGPEPGEAGAAVIAGHIASRRGPGVFYRLGSLRRGAIVTVVLKGGSKVRFVVTGQKQVAKARFPARLVYKRTPDPTLRLITCGGRFNAATGHHVDNTIVFASLYRRP